jgi:hypothetical protein
MKRLDVLRVPARRKVTELNAALAAQWPGFVEAVFRTDSYGTFAVIGQPTGTATLYVAGIEIGSNGKAGRDLVLLREPEQAEPERADDETAVADRAATVASLSAGDAVRAVFEQQPYGPFIVTGICVESPSSSDLLVGSWFLSHAGVPAPRLVAVERIAPAAVEGLDEKGHDIPVPRRMSGWSANRESESASA